MLWEASYEVTAAILASFPRREQREVRQNPRFKEQLECLRQIGDRKRSVELHSPI